MDQVISSSATTRLAGLPALAAGFNAAAGGGMVAIAGQDAKVMTRDEISAAVVARPHLMVNAPLLLGRLGLLPGPGASLPPQYDLLELFAFVRPAAFLVPTTGALARIMGLSEPEDGNAGTGAGAGAGEATALLYRIAAALLQEVASDDYIHRKGAAAAAAVLAQAGWPWAPLVREALGNGRASGATGNREENLQMPAEWRDAAWRTGRGDAPVQPDEALARLRQMLGGSAESRPAQEEYTAACCAAFQQNTKESSAAVSLLEAGTGIGKTLGYIAPASLWAEQSGGIVWLSTFTRNLQRQLEQELARLYPDPAERARRAVVRKGRENYLCLLNLEESLVRAGQRSPGRTQEILLGLILRWLPYSRDGDMTGGDFPRWLTAGAGALGELTDRRGECIHSACAHFRRCFVERAVRRARSAHLVVANHALVLSGLAHGGPGGPGSPGNDGAQLPRRIVFDEGHHLFEAADSAFSFAISGREGAQMRRWFLGAERSGASGGGGRARGLVNRIGALTGEDREAADYLAEIINLSTCLPGPGWRGRIQKARPKGMCEDFLATLRSHVLDGAAHGRHTEEVAASAPGADFGAAATGFQQALVELAAAVKGLASRLQVMQDEDEAADDATADPRAGAAIRGLERRAAILATWRQMLASLLGGSGDSPKADAPRYVDWLAVARTEGREIDYGLHRHWLDPTIPLAEKVLEPADGVIITSATLRDEVQAQETETGWRGAEGRVGGHHLVTPPRRAGFDSPFDYAGQTRVFVVTDVDKRMAAEVAAAYRDLFLASGGGALGIFTSIERLRTIHREISPALDEAALPLLAQHVDAMDTGTLVDIFRAEERACLLGTDAVRDGIDVPGRSLRLIVFDRVPWPRPTILHKARRAHFGGRGYDESLTRLRLKQAYGRLVRSHGDYGVFVVLDAATPSRLLSAFPDGVITERLPLAQVVAKTGEFLDLG